MDALTQIIVAGASSPFVLLAVFLLVAVDGFFPPVPSETLVVALASIGFATGAPDPWLVLLVAAAGSFVGDNIAFTIGRRLGLERFRFTRGRRTARLLMRVRRMLRTSPASLILTARFVPVGRVAVNVLAGSAGFSRKRFLVLSGASGIAWAVYSTLVGVVAGAWLRDQPLVGAAVAAVAALALGVVIDRVSRVVAGRRSRVRRRSASRTTTARVALETTGPAL